MSRPPPEKEATSPTLLQLGTRIRALRTSLGMNQDDFAAAAGMHRSYVGQLENGYKDVRYSTLERIARIGQLEVHQLLDPGYELRREQPKSQ